MEEKEKKWPKTILYPACFKISVNFDRYKPIILFLDSIVIPISYGPHKYLRQTIFLFLTNIIWKGDGPAVFNYII